MGYMLCVAVLDDHPAALAGLQRLLDSTPDLKPVAAATTAEQLSHRLDAARADVVVVDYDLARGDGLSVCQTFKERVRAPAVVIYSACVGPSLAIAGADALTARLPDCLADGDIITLTAAPARTSELCDG